METRLSVALPVDVHRVPLTRALCRRAFEHLQVDPAVVEQITLAISETCADVVRHAGQHEYEVRVEVDDRLCRISVLDHGAGFAPAAVPRGSLLDGGHGPALVRAPVDTLEFRRDPDGRHRVTFETSLGSGRPVPTA